MTPEQIKKELKNRKLSMSAIGRRLRPKVSHVSVKRTVDQIPGQSSKRIRGAVARALGLEPEDVFGDAA